MDSEKRIHGNRAFQGNLSAFENAEWSFPAKGRSDHALSHRGGAELDHNRARPGLIHALGVPVPEKIGVAFVASDQ